MTDMFVLGSEERVVEFEPDENPADSFVTLHCGPVDIESRAQLYALTMGLLFDDAMGVEILERQVTEEGPFFYELEAAAIDTIADLEEEEIEQIAITWGQTETMESLNLEDQDLVEFLFNLVNLCQATNDEIGLYIISEGVGEVSGEG